MEAWGVLGFPPGAEALLADVAAASVGLVPLTVPRLCFHLSVYRAQTRTATHTVTQQLERNSQDNRNEGAVGPAGQLMMSL